MGTNVNKAHDAPVDIDDPRALWLCIDTELPERAAPDFAVLCVHQRWYMNIGLLAKGSAATKTTKIFSFNNPNSQTLSDFQERHTFVLVPGDRRAAF